MILGGTGTLPLVAPLNLVRPPFTLNNHVVYHENRNGETKVLSATYVFIKMNWGKTFTKI